MTFTLISHGKESQMKNRLFVMIAALILLLGIAHAKGEIVSKEQLNEPGRKIGVSQGSAAEEAI